MTLTIDMHERPAVFTRGADGLSVSWKESNGEIVGGRVSDVAPLAEQFGRRGSEVRASFAARGTSRAPRL
jgi:hypothetical protein